MAKSAGKSRAKSRLFKPGGPQGPGRGPDKGAPNAGRPPDAFKEMCRQLASSSKVEKAVQDILSDPAHSMFVQALKWATENGYGKPTETRVIEGGDKPVGIKVLFANE